MRHQLRKYVAAAVMLLTATQALQAQEAFYVYRNDGEFNGFFYDQVIRMGCSKVDNEGITHDEYVIQEIETADSLYRIPLAAIDSIGFQQPEIILNPKMKTLEETGLRPYITGAWHQLVYDNTGQGVHKTSFKVEGVPKELLPKVGDVIVEWDEEWCKQQGIRTNSISGKVSAVKSTTDGIYILTEPLSDLSDIFIQFITTEQITADRNGNVKHRLAGWNPEGPRKAYEDTADKSFIDVNTTLKRTFSPKDGVDVTLECAVELAMKMHVSYYISLSRLYVKTDIFANAGVQPALTLAASTSFDTEVEVVGPIGTVKFPANLPIFQTKPFPKFDLKLSGSANLQLTLPKVGFDYSQSVTFNSKASPMMSFSKKESQPGDKETEVPFSSAGDISLSLNGSVQAGVEFTTNIATNDWVEDIFYSGIGLSIMVGPKLEGRLEFSTAGLADQGAYGAFKNSYIKFHPLSVDLEAKADLKFLWKDKESNTFLEASRQFGSVEWYLLPDFTDIKAEYDHSRREIDFSAMTRRKTFLPNYVNVGLFNYDNEPIEKYQHSMPMFIGTDSMEVKKSFAAKKAGSYNINYGTSVLGIDVNAGKKVVEVPSFVRHEKEGMDSITVSGAAQQVRQLIETNVAKLNQVYASGYFMRIDNYTTDHIAKATISDLNLEDETAWLNLDVQPNNTCFSRYEIIRLSTSGASGTMMDTLKLKQEPLYKDILKLRLELQGSACSYKTTVTSKDGTTTVENGSTGLPFKYWMDIPITCSRQGDVFTLTGSGSFNSYADGHNDVAINMTADFTNRIKPVTQGRLELVHYTTRGSKYLTAQVEFEHIRNGIKENSSGLYPQEAETDDTHGYFYIRNNGNYDIFNVKSCKVELHDYEYDGSHYHHELGEVQKPNTFFMFLNY